MSRTKAMGAISILFVLFLFFPLIAQAAFIPHGGSTEISPVLFRYFNDDIGGSGSIQYGIYSGYPEIDPIFSPCKSFNYTVPENLDVLWDLPSGSYWMTYFRLFADVGCVESVNNTLVEDRGINPVFTVVSSELPGSINTSTPSAIITNLGSTFWQIIATSLAIVFGILVAVNLAFWLIRELREYFSI